MSAEHFNEDYDMPVTNAAGAIHQSLRFLRVVWHRKSTLLFTAIIVGLIGAWYASTATRYYESNASILIVQNGIDESTVSLGVNTTGQSLMPTHQRLVVCQPVLESAIKYLPDYCFAEFKGMPPDSWHHVLERKVSTSSVKNTTVLNVGYSSTDPKICVAVVKAIIQSYLNFIDDTHKGTAAKILDVMTREKDQLAAELAEKEGQLMSARLSVGDFSVQDGATVIHPLVQTVISMNEALIEAQKERLKHEAMLVAIQKAISRGEDLKQYAMAVEETIGKELLMTGLGFNQNNAQIRSRLEQGLLKDFAQLKSFSNDYGPAHPRVVEIENRIQTTQQYMEYQKNNVQSRIEEMEANQLGPLLVQMIQQELSKAWQRESILRNHLDDARQQAVLHERDTAHINMLSHSVGRLRKLHEALVEQIANVDLRHGQGEIRATIVKEAIASGEIVSPRPSRIIFICIFATACIGCGIIYIQDIIDDRFRTPDELSKRVGQQVLAMVDALPILTGQGLEMVQACKAPASVEVESFRTLRTSIALSSNESSRVAFTSAEPGDGKTTIISNLAVVYAQSGKKTLLIDADLRRPGLTRLLGMKSKPGLSDILYANENLREIVDSYIFPTDIPQLDLMSAGPRRQNPTELLSSERMAELLAWAETEYDQILIDCPPVLVASDAILIGKIVDGSVLVVRPEKNRRKIVFRATESLTGMGIHLFGIVTNCITMAGGKGYSFGYGEGYGYDYGYDRNEDDDSEDADVAINFKSRPDAVEVSQDSQHLKPTTPRRAA